MEQKDQGRIGRSSLRRERKIQIEEVAVGRGPAFPDEWNAPWPAQELPPKGLDVGR
jgi:hypothetical protein